MEPTFEIRSYSKSELASLYSPYTTQKAAVRKLNRWIALQPGLQARLDATGITMTLNNKRGKSTKKIKKCKTIQVNFTVTKNVTAQSGMKTFYVRITSPTGALLGNAGSFAYENRSLNCTMKKTVEYGGQELALTTYWDVTQTLVEGTYQVSIFADGNMIGSRSFTFK